MPNACYGLCWLFASATLGAEPATAVADAPELYIWREVRTELLAAAQLFRERKFETGAAKLKALENASAPYGELIRDARLYESLSGQPRDPWRSQFAWRVLEDYHLAKRSAEATGEREPVMWCRAMLGDVDEPAEFYGRGNENDPSTLPHGEVLLQWKSRCDVLAELQFIRRHLLGTGRPSIASAFAALFRLTSLLDHVSEDIQRREIFEVIGVVLSGLGDEAGRRAWEDRALASEAWVGTNDRAAVLIRRGNLAFQAKDFAVAEELFRVCAEQHANSSSYGMAQFNLSYTLQQKKQFAAAIREYAKLFISEVNDKDPGGHIMEAFRNYRHRAAVETARCHEALNQIDQALAWVELAGTKYRYHSWCGNCQLDTANWLANYQQLLRLKLPLPE